MCKKCFDSPLFNKTNSSGEITDNKEIEEDDDPDINFEVRSTKLANKSEEENSIKSRDSSKNRLNNSTGSKNVDSSHLGINQKTF